MLHLRYLSHFRISFDLRIYQRCKHARVLNMSALYKFLNKRFVIDVWHYSQYVFDSEYALSSEYTRVTKGSVESAPSYMFDMVLNIPYVLRILGLEYKRVFEYATVTQGSMKTVFWHCILRLYIVNCILRL